MSLSPSFLTARVDPRGYETVPELERGLAAYFAVYNGKRLHPSLGYKTPAEVYGGTTRDGEE